MKCPKGHNGAVMLFSSVACDLCDSIERFNRLRQIFLDSVRKFGPTKPNRARVGPNMREALATWTGCPPELVGIHFEPEDIQEGRLVLFRAFGDTGIYRTMTFEY